MQAALDFYKRSAVRGNDYAHYNLGTIYLNHHDHDHDQAIYHFIQSASQYNIMAIKKISDLVRCHPRFISTKNTRSILELYLELLKNHIIEPNLVQEILTEKKVQWTIRHHQFWPKFVFYGQGVVWNFNDFVTFLLLICKFRSQSCYQYIKLLLHKDSILSIIKVLV